MTELISIGHNSGNLSEYDSLSDSGSDLSAPAGAALGDTTYGMAVQINDSDEPYGEVAFTVSTNQIRFRFYFDPNNFSFTSGDQFGFGGYILCDGTWNSQTTLFYVSCRQNSGTWEIRPQTYNDTAASQYAGWITMTDIEHYLEIHIVRETYDGGNDGYMDIWLDGVALTGVTGIDNYNLFPTIASLVNGIPWWGMYTSTTGTFFLDEFVVNDDGTEIGPVAGATPTQPLQVSDDLDDWEIDYEVSAYIRYESGESGNLGYLGEYEASHYYVGGFRFVLDRALPDGCIITAATLRLYGQNVWNWGSGCYLRVWVTDSDDAPRVTVSTDRPSWQGSGMTTTHPAAAGDGHRWPDSGDLTWSTTGWNSVDISDLIQYLVDTYSGLAQEAGIVVWVSIGELLAGGEEVGFNEYAYSSANAAQLDLEWTEGGVPMPVMARHYDGLRRAA